MKNNRKSIKAGGIIKLWELHNSISQKVLPRDIFPLAPAANMLGTSQFFTGCMKWQHAVILEPICETDSILYFLPASSLLTGLLTPHCSSDSLYCSLLLPFTWTNYSRSNSLSPFYSVDKIILSPNPLPSSNRTKLF